MRTAPVPGGPRASPAAGCVPAAAGLEAGWAAGAGQASPAPGRTPPHPRRRRAVAAAEPGWQAPLPGNARKSVPRHREARRTSTPRSARRSGPRLRRTRWARSPRAAEARPRGTTGLRKRCSPHRWTRRSPPGADPVVPVPAAALRCRRCPHQPGRPPEAAREPAGRPRPPGGCPGPRHGICGPGLLCSPVAAVPSGRAVDQSRLTAP